jgi:hypothetical protein
LALVEAEAIGQAGLGDVRHLRRGRDDQLLEPRIPLGQHAPALERCHGLARGAQGPRHLRRGDGIESRHVVVAPRLEEGIHRPVIVDQRLARQRRRQHVGNSGQRLVVEHAGGGEILGGGATFRDARRDRLADVAQLVPGKRRLLRRTKARQRGVGADGPNALQIADREDPLLRARGLGHATQPRMGDGAAQERDLEHAGPRDVADKTPPAMKKPRVFLAPKRRADAEAAHLTITSGCGKPRS